MSHWLTIILAVVCGFNGLWQIRMTLVYLGILQSAVVGPVRSISLAHISLCSALSSLAYSAILLFIPWPKLITFVIGMLALRELVDLFFVLLAIGNYGVTRDSPKLRLHHLKVQSILVALYAVGTAVSAHFLGY